MPEAKSQPHAPLESTPAVPDRLLGAGVALIAIACLLWLGFVTHALSGQLPAAYYPMREHALLFLLGICLVSQSLLANAPHGLASRPVKLRMQWLGTPGYLAIILAVAAVIGVVTRIPELLSLVWAGFGTSAYVSGVAVALSNFRSGRWQPLALVGMICGFAGGGMMASVAVVPDVSAHWQTLAKLLLFDAMPQLALLALIAAAQPFAIRTVATAAFAVSLYGEAMGDFPAAFGLRALVIGLILWRSWRGLPSPLGFWCGLIAACWVGGTAAIAIWPQYMIHLKHFVYLGVYLTLTALAVCLPMRWSVANPSAVQPTAAISRKRFNWIVGLIALAALTRATAFVSHSSYVRHLAYAAGIILVGIILGWAGYRKARPGHSL